MAALAISYARIIKALRRKSTEPRLQDSTLDLGKHHGGPWANQDTYSFKFVPIAAGPGGPGWGSPCAVYCVSHSVYSCLTNKWAEYRVWDTPVLGTLDWMTGSNNIDSTYG